MHSLFHFECCCWVQPLQLLQSASERLVVVCRLAFQAGHKLKGDGIDRRLDEAGRWLQ